MSHHKPRSQSMKYGEDRGGEEKLHAGGSRNWEGRRKRGRRGEEDGEKEKEEGKEKGVGVKGGGGMREGGRGRSEGVEEG